MSKLLLLISSPIFARSIKGTIDNMGKQSLSLGLALSVLGIAIGAASLMFGKQDATQKIVRAVMAIAIFSGAPAIVNFVKGLVR